MSLNLPGGIELRRMTFDNARVDEWRALLSEAELSRYEAFPVEKRKREFLLGRAALRTLLADRLEEPPEAIRVRVTDDGALELPDHPLHICITHADDRAVAAVSRQPVGVDLEPIAERNSDVERFLLHSDEQPLLDTLPMDRPAAFILCWTLKEATLKAMGTGLLRSPKKVRLSIDAEVQTARAEAWDGSRWALQYERADAYFLSVAYPAE